MKFNQILESVRLGDLHSIGAKTLKTLGQRYLEKHPECTRQHSHQNKAQILINFANDNPHATSEACCRTFIDVLSELPEIKGWLAEKTLTLLGKAFRLDIIAAILAEDSRLFLEPKQFAQHCNHFLQRYIDEHSTKLQPLLRKSYSTTNLMEQSVDITPIPRPRSNSCDI
ncbi:hypothetical protein [Piscirickettsia salmonis]|uniref:hypothetical protein n=1 Tax=Piscirickettsia salmonis TaxID=1238 RepID=UPI0007C892BB|nr:hypothetical protein A0O36_01006 [Piscirickettsiaceae bacterium NZ-RLO1]